jgi:hypothetical protein
MMHTSSTSLHWPVGLGASSVWRLSDGRQLTLFVVDQTLPLYNVIIGSLRFFANAEQVTTFVEQLSVAPGDHPRQPSWKWVFESGFEQSVDGSRNKRWCLHDG